jgi:gamma-glutamyltranspeptidase/glutathione hydrolase
MVTPMKALLLPALALAASAMAQQPQPLPQAAPLPSYAQLVSAADPRASAAGLEMLKLGGSAADAAAATMLALTVVEPQSSGIGGGGLLLFRDASGKMVALDGREMAPAAARPDQFLGPDGKPKPFPEAATGGKAVGVPGNIRLIAEAHRRWGKLSWAALFGPAIKLAEGFTASPRLATFTGYGLPHVSRDAEAAALYLREGRPLSPGAALANPALAATFRTLAAKGPDAFYTGPIAATIAAKVSNAGDSPLAMTAADLAGYKVRERPVICLPYRVYRICTMSAPSGGPTMLAMLKQLERFDIGKLGPDNPVAWHLFAESQRLAYADRDQYAADPDFVTVPVAGLTNAAYLEARSALISPDKTMASVSAGVPAGAPKDFGTGGPQNEHGTSHFVAGDKWGAVVTYTSTIERPFGSGLMAGGFMLNNEMTDFNLAPTKDGKATANRLQPGKRPRSAMSPTIVTDQKGKVVLVIGAAGGVTIPAQVAKAIIGVLDWHLNVAEALALPQIIAIGDQVRIEQGSKLEAMKPALEALGHKVSAAGLPLKANGLEPAGNGWRGAADPRSEGQVAGF